MHGANPLRSRERSDGQVLKLQGAPFLTIQGEGPYAGLPAVFVRLWGCHLACQFCDTDFESEERAWSIYDIARACRGVSLVVLTGGEPMRQNLAPLIALLYAGHAVQIETAGSFWWEELQNLASLKIVVSPKTPHVHPEIRKMAYAWKYIISESQIIDVDGFPVTDTQDRGSRARPLAKPPTDFPGMNVYLQPMDEGDELRNRKNLNRCIRLAKTHGYRVSLQQHKIMGVP